MRTETFATGEPQPQPQVQKPEAVRQASPKAQIRTPSLAASLPPSVAPSVVPSVVPQTAASRAEDRAEQLRRSLIEAALASLDYRDFLRRIFEVQANCGKRSNLSAFSRRAGFSSRSYVKDVMTGRRRITASSLPKFVRAFALPPLLKQLFQYLVMRDERDLNVERIPQAQVESRLSEIKSRLQVELATTDISKRASGVLFLSRNVLEVYCALGSPERGASFEEILGRTGLTRATVEGVVKYLLGQELAVERGARYFATNPHYIFNNLGGHDAFRTIFMESLHELACKAPKRFGDHESLFYQSVFSVDRKHLPELKRRLREVLQEFVDTQHKDEGDCVSKILLGFFQ